MKRYIQYLSRDAAVVFRAWLRLYLCITRTADVPRASGRTVERLVGGCCGAIAHVIVLIAAGIAMSH